MNEQRLRRARLRLRIAGILIALGLLIEWFSLRETTPVTFMVFGIAMGICFPIGTLLFLSTLIRTAPSDDHRP